MIYRRSKEKISEATPGITRVSCHDGKQGSQTSLDCLLACIFLRLCIVLSLVFGILQIMQIHAMHAIVGAYFDYHVLCRSPIQRGKKGKGCRHPVRLVHKACIVPKLAAAGVVHIYTHTICMVPDIFRFYIFFAMICVHAWKKVHGRTWVVLCVLGLLCFALLCLSGQ
jgi:hypothetical protein